MNTKWIVQKFIIAALVLFVSGAAIAIAMDQVKDGIKTYNWRYKMTVEVETPEGIKTGSAVREMNLMFEPRPLDPPKQFYVSHKMRGEAVAVDLGKHGVVFAYFSSDSYPEVTDTFEGPPMRTLEGAEYYSSLEAGPTPVAPQRVPWIVTFSDLSDPMSVEMVKGGVFNVEEQKHILVDRFEELFGEGFRLRSVTVEMTDEPVTWKIEAYLPWLAELKGGYLDGRFSGGGPELSNILYGGNFKIGDISDDE